MAAYEIPSFSLGVIESDIDLSGSQFKAVNVHVASVAFGTEGAALILPAVAGDPALGIVQNNPGISEPGAVMVHGVSKAIAGGTITAGALLAAGTDGRLSVATTGQYAIAQALMSAVANDIFSVALIRNGKV